MRWEMKGVFMSTKIENAIFFNTETDEDEVIYYQSLDTDLYIEKYKGKLTCFNGCKARIKFTQRKNNTKFFSTWNKEGDLHEKECQYHVDYKGKMGRQKLKALFEEEELDSDRIMQTVKRKLKELKELNDTGEKKPSKLTTLEIDNVGEGDVIISKDGDASEIITTKRLYIGSLDAQYLDPSYISTRKCIFGIVNNVQVRENDSNEKYAYINLNNTMHNVSVYLPPAFYKTENNDIDRLDKFIKSVEKITEKDEILFVGVGFIESKKNSGLNIRILDKDHFLINEKTYDDIVRTGF